MNRSTIRRFRSATSLPMNPPDDLASASTRVPRDTFAALVRSFEWRHQAQVKKPPLSRSPGELLHQLARFLVAVLNGRALHEVRGRAEQRTADAPVLGDLAAAERVDDHAGRVGGVPHLELELDVEGHVTEVAALDADVGPLAVVEPRHMVARADVDVVVGDALVDLARDRLRLRDLLGLQPLPLEHVLEVHVAAEVQLVCAVDRDAAILEQAGEHAVHDGRPYLALDVVPDDRHASLLEPRSPLGVTSDEHRDGVDERGLGVEAGLRVVTLRLLGADREVGHEDVGAGVAQDLRDVDRRRRRLLAGLAVELTEAVERRAAHDGHAELADLRELHRVVLAGPDRLAGVETDLLGVDVERRHELDVADVVAAEHHVHEARHLVRRVGVLVVLKPLDEGVGAVADAGDRQADLAHGWVPPVAVTTGSGTAGTISLCVMRVRSSQPSSSVGVVMSRSLRERWYGSGGRSVRGSAALG